MTIDLQRSTGIHLSFGYPADVGWSFLVDLRYLFVDSASDMSNLDVDYYDLGLGGRYTVALGDSTDFMFEAAFLGSTMKFSDTNFGANQSESGIGVLARAGVVLFATSGRSLVVSGSYSIARVESPLNSDEHIFPAFFSLELAVEWKL